MKTKNITAKEELEMTTKGTPQKSDRENAVIIIVALLLFGLTLGGFGFYKYSMGKESMAWPSAKGKITYSHAAPHRGDSGQQFLPSVKYTYNVNGKAYTGRRITSSDVYQRNLGSAKDILKKYPIGGEVAVYYDPADPGTSLLEIGIRRNVYVLLGGAALCFFLAGAIAVSAKKKNRLVAR
jgi:hypothetical protein